MSLYQSLNKELHSKNVSLVAVSKTKPVSLIQQLYDQGQRIFGENRVNELVEKYNTLPKDIEWHMIGHLQKNKVKYLASFISLIHSVDNFELAKIINKEAVKNERVIDILLQLKIAKEDAKTGFEFDELKKVLPDILSLPSVNVIGVMGMGTFTDDENVTHSEFRMLKSYFEELRDDFLKETPTFAEISMGMSGDYKIAMEYGTTMVRIGSLLFGER